MVTTGLHLPLGSPAERRQAITRARRSWAQKTAAERTAEYHEAVRRAPSVVRRDRKFYTSLALHEAVLDHLKAEPERVRSIGLLGVERTRPNTRGSATRLLDDWEKMLRSSDFAALEEALTGVDERAVEMRNLSPFAGVLGECEHSRIREQVLRERRWAA